MTDRPILFSAPMVRAILEGRKTQTRRVFVPPPPFAAGDDITVQLATGSIAPRHKVGDRLWVREAWAPLAALTHGDPGVQALADRGFYRADNSTVEGEISRWRPSIHMPRWASRITLEVTGVKVERLQDISEADAIAEGIDDVTAEIAPRDKSLRFWRRYRDGGWNGYVDCPIGSYASLWTEINGDGSWEANPWVVAIAFKRVTP